MSKTNQWMLTRLAELGLSVYDFDSEAAVRQQLVDELEAMAEEHDKFRDLSGSLHNSELEPCDWEVV